MDKLNMHTANVADENYKKLAALFPNAVTEAIDPETGEVVRAIDKDVLMQEISAHVVEGREERYQFTWPDKKKAMLAANAPISATLRPVVADSVGKDGTPGGWDSENLYIEGDNLDVLKLLQETYLGKVKMIYIDPPYNTGNDFVYEDDFSEDAEGYVYERSGQYDEQGNRLVQNTESNGRFHTDWLNMMYSRIKFARNLLSEDGALYISIDDNEYDNLFKICNELLGASNHVATLAWQRTLTRRNDAKKISFAHEYIIIFAKSYDHLCIINESVGDKQRSTYSNRDNDPRGDWLAVPFHAPNIRPNLTYPITLPSGREVYPPVGRCWSTTPDKYQELLADNRIYFGNNGDGMPQRKKFWAERGDNEGVVPWTWWPYDYAGENREATKEFKLLFDDATLFNGPKPTKLIRRLLQLTNTKDSIILDFFSGSATTAHAVMQLNAEDGGHRKFIMVQLPEKTDESSEAYKAGYPNICEIGKERIRRAGRKIKEEFIMRNAQCVMDTNNSELRIKNYELSDLDIGFRVLRLDSSNMQDVYYNPAALTQDLLSITTDNIKPDRTPLDLLFQVMLDLGVALSSPIARTEIDGKAVYDVADGFLLACFDAGVTTETVTAIARRKPYYAVFRDSSMADDSTATNFDQIFETYSPSTVRKVL